MRIGDAFNFLYCFMLNRWIIEILDYLFRYIYFCLKQKKNFLTALTESYIVNNAGVWRQQKSLKNF